MAAHVTTVNGSRLRTMVVPREHGAWGMLLVPLATGAVVALRTGVNSGALTLFIVAAMSLFWLRTPVEAWLGTSAIKAQTGAQRGFVLRVIFAIGLLAGASIATLLWNSRNRGLLVIGGVAGLAFVVQAGVKKLGRKGRMPAQIMARSDSRQPPRARSTLRRASSTRRSALWLANWLFAGDQIHYVQVRIHSGRATTMDEKLVQGLPFLAGQVVVIGVILAACRLRFFPTPVSLALFRAASRDIVVRSRTPAAGCAPAATANSDKR